MARKPLAVLWSVIFLVIAPGIVAGVIPCWISQWRLAPAFLGTTATRIPGMVLLALSLIGLLDSFARFALQGLGTPAPVFPTRHLVVTGLYRYVRNPMYVAVVSAILGQGLILANLRVLAYGAVVWLLFHFFVLIYEEPVLQSTYLPSYTAFRRAVPRWTPRLKPWRGAA